MAPDSARADNRRPRRDRQRWRKSSWTRTPPRSIPAREIEAQNGDALARQLRGDAAYRGQVLRAGEAMGKQRIAAHRPARQVEACSQRGAGVAGKFKPLGQRGHGGAFRYWRKSIPYVRAGFTSGYPSAAAVQNWPRLYGSNQRLFFRWSGFAPHPDMAESSSAATATSELFDSRHPFTHGTRLAPRDSAPTALPTLIPVSGKGRRRGRHPTAPLPSPPESASGFIGFRTLWKPLTLC